MVEIESSEQECCNPMLALWLRADCGRERWLLQMRADGALDQAGNSGGDEVISEGRQIGFSLGWDMEERELVKKEESRMNLFFFLEQLKRAAINWNLKGHREVSFDYGGGVVLLFSRSVMSNSLQPHGLQHARLPCPSPTPRVCANSCPLRQWLF